MCTHTAHCDAHSGQIILTFCREPHSGLNREQKVEKSKTKNSKINYSIYDFSLPQKRYKILFQLLDFLTVIQPTRTVR
jgi:hypothetical protein